MRLRWLAFVAAMSFAMFAVVGSWAADESKSDIAVITQYVISYKHWSPKIFRIERAECDCAYALYRIVYLPEANKPVTANSKSFAVHYDEQRRRIVQETKFQ